MRSDGIISNRIRATSKASRGTPAEFVRVLLRPEPCRHIVCSSSRTRLRRFRGKSGAHIQYGNWPSSACSAIEPSIFCHHRQFGKLKECIATSAGSSTPPLDIIRRECAAQLLFSVVLFVCACCRKQQLPVWTVTAWCLPAPVSVASSCAATAAT